MNINPVANGVYRSNEPQPSDYETVKRFFATVVMFEGDEKEIAGLAPTVVISQPISFAQMHIPWCAISASQLDYIVTMVMGLCHFVNFINHTKPRFIPLNVASKNVLVHCKMGQDRTGLICAAYRVKYCGWTPQAAMDEAIKLGYRHLINFGLNATWKSWLKECEDFPV